MDRVPFRVAATAVGWLLGWLASWLAASVYLCSAGSKLVSEQHQNDELRLRASTPCCPAADGGNSAGSSQPAPSSGASVSSQGPPSTSSPYEISAITASSPYEIEISAMTAKASAACRGPCIIAGPAGDLQAAYRPPGQSSCSSGAAGSLQAVLQWTPEVGEAVCVRVTDSRFQQHELFKVVGTAMRRVIVERMCGPRTTISVMLESIRPPTMKLPCECGLVNFEQVQGGSMLPSR